MSLMMGVSGIRGLVNQTMTSQLATDFGLAFGTYLGGGYLSKFYPYQPESSTEKVGMLNLSEVKFPSETVRVCPVWNKTEDRGSALCYPPSSTTSRNWQPPGWHGGQNNVLMVDGHVQGMKTDDILKERRGENQDIWFRLVGPKKLR